MIVFKLKDCNIINIYNSFTDGYYDENLYGCPTCGGGMEPDVFAVTVITDKGHRESVHFYDDYADKAMKNFLPWVLENRNSFENDSLYTFIHERLVELDGL